VQGRVIKRRAENKQRWLCFKGFSHNKVIANSCPVREAYAEVSPSKFRYFTKNQDTEPAILKFTGNASFCGINLLTSR
jgi:hypothetical protein